MDERRVGEREESFLKLLSSLAAAGQHGAQAPGVVGRIAAWIDSPRVLEVICRHPPWFGNWQVKEALLRNAATPAGPRQVLERQIAVFDLLRELDSPGLGAGERQEIREDVRGLLSTLSAEDRIPIKQRALELSSSRRRPPESAAGPPGREGAEAAEEPSDEAGGTALEEAAPAALEFAFPEPEYEELGTGEFVLDDLLTEAESASSEPLEAPPPMAAEPSSAALGPILEIVEIEAATLEAEEPKREQPRAEGASQLAPGRPAQLGEELEAARTSTDSQVLSALAQRPVETLQLALLENSALPELAAVSLARRGTATVASRIYHSQRWFSRPRIREALLACPAAPAAAQLEALGSLRSFAKLLEVLSSPRIRHLEVKAKARSRLRGLFQTLSQGEKLAAVRTGGRSLLRQLWTDFFRDEPLVLRCLREKRLDEGTVLEIARSKIAPRRALEEIGNNAAWAASYPIRLALVMNPKTPRPIAARLLQRLKPADRKMLRKNMAISAALRNKA